MWVLAGLPVRLEKFSLAILGSTGFHLGTPYEIDCDVRDYNYYEITYTQLYFDYNLGEKFLQQFSLIAYLECLLI